MAQPRTLLTCSRQCLRTVTPLRLRLSSSSKNYSTNLNIIQSARWRSVYAVTGISASVLTYYFAFQSNRSPSRLEAPPSSSPRSALNNPAAPIQISNDDEEVEQVPTGTSTVPLFPRTIRLPSSASAEQPTTQTRTLPYGTGPPSQESEEYRLLGLGIRKVSFLKIQVYVVGLYVAKSDFPKLQEGLVRSFFTSSAKGDSAVSAATTLVENEKEELRKVLMVDGVEEGRGEQMWDEVLKTAGVKTVLRIVTTRNTDFGHMREGWVRSIQSRTTNPARPSILGTNDAGLDESVNEFKAIFGGGRKGVNKGKQLWLSRSAQGDLTVYVEEELSDAQERLGKKAGMKFLGGLKDERISRLVWLGYLAGANVASEGARKSVVDGVMEIVERPIGTVATQVV